MSIDPNYALPESDEADFNNDESSQSFNDSLFELHFEVESGHDNFAKRDSKRGFNAQRKIERIKEERRLKKLLENDYDDWH